MIFKIKKLIVISLDRFCSLVDNNRPFTRCWFADWSAELDERWSTNLWKEESLDEDPIDVVE